jgi:hypothetical protein
MKTILASLIFLASAVSAQAVTLTPLAVPSAVPDAYPARVACIATSFNADDSVNGTCQSQTASASSGRGGHPTYTNLVYTATWGVNGNALTPGTYCGTFVVNVPSVHIWTYAAGFNATTCYVPTPGSTQILLYDPSYGFDVWFFYITTSANGAYALIAEGVYGYIYGF